MPIMQKVAVHPMSTMKDKKESKDGPKVKDGAQEVVIGMGMESVGGGGGGGGGGDMGDDMVGDRCDSQMSSISERLDICRICHCEGEEGNRLKSPCLCLGSLRYVHLRCLQKWIKSSEKMSCELCRFEYIMTTKTKPFREWEKLDMSTAERRKIICSVSFHVIAITCVIWSLYVLIDRTAEEVASGNLDWPFWTKLIVVAIGFIGGLVFMYVQCKMYVQLVLRWRSYNKVLHIEDVPETEEFRINALAKIKTRMEESGGVGGVTNSVAMQEIESF